MSKQLGLKIKQLRSNYSVSSGKKITQKDLAEKLGISRSYLGDIESGRTTPNEILLGKIADVFDTDIYELIGKNENIEIEVGSTNDVSQSSKVKEAIKKIDGNSAVKKYIKETDFNELIKRILDENTSIQIKTLRDNIVNLAKIEEDEFKEINNINKNDFSLEASVVGLKFISNSNKNILNKINSILNLEIAKTTDILESKNKYHSEPIAAHAKKDATLEDIQHDNDIMDNDDIWND